MNRVDDLLRSLRSKGIKIWTENGELHYRAPKDTILPGDVEILRALKVHIIHALENDQPAPLAPRSPTDVVPLTFQQQWLWDRQQGDIDDRNVISLSQRVLGPLDNEILRDAIDAVCARHEALRTRIVTVHGIPRQLITDAARCNLQVSALRGKRSHHVVDDARRMAREFLDEPVSRSERPLFKAKLLKLTRHDHVLVLAMHHMISDGLSARILVRELCLFYARLAKGLSSSIPAIPVQYPDYAVWQRKSHGLWKEQHESYWRARLEGARRIQLPPDGNITGMAPFSAAMFEIRLGRTLSDGLRQFARREKTTLARTMLAVYVSFVSTLCSTRDFVVPFNIMGRHLASLSDSIGFFAHILYLRMQLVDGDTFRDVLRRVNVELDSASKHLDFGQMGLLMPEFHAGTRFHWDQPMTPHATTGASLFISEIDSIRIEKFQVAESLSVEAKATIDVVLNFSDGPHGVVGTVSYRADLFTVGAMQRFARDMQSLIRKVLEEPGGYVPRSAAVPIL